MAVCKIRCLVPTCCCKLRCPNNHSQPYVFRASLNFCLSYGFCSHFRKHKYLQHTVHREFFMLNDAYPYYLANEAVFANKDLAVTDKFTGDVATVVAQADAKAFELAISAAADAMPAMAALQVYQRKAILEHCIQRFEERFEELSMSLCIEAGKPINDAKGEVTRLIDTFRVAAAEVTRIDGEVLELSTTERAHGYRGFTRHAPVGPCAFISPFNFPLNLAAHKVAPAIAAGCPFVLKPASATPLGALIIGEVLAETDLPKGAFSILPADRHTSDILITDDRLKLLSFTGS